MKQHLAALTYAQYHWSVIPIRAFDKRPLTKWQEYQQRCASVDEINQWYQHWPNANVGIVTGSISSIVVLDIDPEHGGVKNLAAWEKQYGSLPHTVEVKTGGGGRHLYFKHPGGVVHNKAGIAPGIDIRGDGGCVVAPPSTHSSGKHYTWAKGHEPGEINIADCPAWLLGLIRGEGKPIGHTAAYWRQFVREGVPEGERNNGIASLTGHLLWHGVDPDVVQELLLCWNRVRAQPPLDDEEVVRIVQSITRLHEQEEE
jgi:bifunctional DNA primase/polymerase-like protein/primase-like protein